MALPKMILQFECEPTVDGMDKAIDLIKYAEKIGFITTFTSTDTVAPPTPASSSGNGKAVPKAAAPSPPPKPAPGKKPAPAAALATAPGKKAPAAAPKPASKPALPEADLDLSGGDEDEDDDQTGGLDLGDMFDAPADFKGTPEEAKEEALGLLRIMLANNHKDHVKRVQQIMRVAKFHDVPPEQGFEFLKRVKEVQAKI